MKIQTIINHTEWSNRIRRRGIRRVAREAKISPSYISKLVNNKIVCTPYMLERLRVATNALKPAKKYFK